MRKLLLVLAAGIMAGCLYGQTCQNCGFGITTALSKLHIKGCGVDSTTSSFRATDSAGNVVLFVRDDKRVGVNTIYPKSILDITSTTSGLLIPRMTQTQRNAIASPATGLLIYQTNSSPGFYYYNGTSWAAISTNAWGLTGNAGTTSGTNFLGTTDNVSLRIRTNNSTRVTVDSLGKVGIGTTSPTANYLLTLKTSSSIPSGISLPLAGASSTAYGINISASSANYRGVFATNSSSSSGVFYGIAGDLSGGTAATGYLGYRNSSSINFAVYGTGGDLAGMFAGKVGINSVSTSLTSSDIEVRNNTSGANPVDVFMRQTSNNTAANSILGNLDYGDNYNTSAQARIQVLRDAISSSSSDLPTAFAFLTTADGTTTLTERMRIDNSGKVGIGTSSPSSLFSVGSSSQLQINSSGNIVKLNNVTTSFPSSQGSANTVLTNDGSGNLSWSTLSQSAADTYGSGQLAVTSSTTTFTTISGLTQTITVPANTVLLISTNGGFSTNSSSSSGQSTVDIVIEIDGSTPANGSWQRFVSANTSGVANKITDFAMTKTVTLSAGSHTIDVRTKYISGSSCTVSDDNTGVQQGTLSVTVLKN